jgi:GT2 family glycosyltransferase
MIKTSIILSTTNFFNDKTQRCYKALKEVCKEDYQIIVTETHNNDTIFCNEPIYNHSRDMNVALKGVDAKYYIILNNDVYVKEGWLENLVSTAESDSSIGVVGSLLLFPNNTIQHAGGLFLDYNKNRFDQIGVGHRHYAKTINAEVMKQRDCPFVTGASMLITRECLKDIGILEESLNLSMNDVEYCLRAWENNYRVVYQPKSQAVHEESVSIKENSKFTTGTGLHYKYSWLSLKNRWSEQYIRNLENNVKKSNLKHNGYA